MRIMSNILKYTIGLIILVPVSLLIIIVVFPIMNVLSSVISYKYIEKYNFQQLVADLKIIWDAV